MMHARIKHQMGNLRWVLRAFAALLIVGIWAGALKELSQEEDRAFASATNDAENYARALAEHSTRTLRSAEQAALFIKHQYETQGGARLDLLGYMASGVIPGDIFNLYSIVDARGDLVASTRPFQPINLADREHIRVHMESDTGRAFVSRPVLGRVSGKWSMQVTRRLNAPDGSFAGVVIVSMDPYYFSRFYSDFRIGARGSLSLIGDDGIVRSRLVGKDNSLGQDVSGSTTFRRFLTEAQGTFTAHSVIDAMPRMLAWRRLPDYPLFVVVGMAREDLMPEIRHDRAMLLGVALLGTLLVAGFTTALEYFTRKLERVSLEAVAANEAKTRFVGNMSHELRTPLNGIIGYADLLADDLAGTEQAAFADVIRSSGRHLLAIVNDVLDIGRIEAGGMTIHRRPEALGSLLDEVLATHAPGAAAKGIALERVVEPGVPDQVECDRTRVLQVLNNLVHNAVKFTAEGRVSLRVARDGASLVFRVTDTGPGIAPADQANLFNKFVQVDSSVVRAHEGTGLGLALVKELSALMGGRAWVDSAPGRGATFAFTLPV